MFDRPITTFLRILKQILFCMLMTGLLTGDMIFIEWLYTNGHEIWSCITVTVTVCVLIYLMFYDEYIIWKL